VFSPAASHMVWEVIKMYPPYAECCCLVWFVYRVLIQHLLAWACHCHCQWSLQLMTVSLWLTIL